MWGGESVHVGLSAAAGVVGWGKVEVADAVAAVAASVVAGVPHGGCEWSL